MQFDSEALEELKTYPWTGNVRELRNVVERLAILCDQVITLDDVRLYAQPLQQVKQ
jgi:DNA-binding NtrC family response regulator